jgi:superfamily II DNA or RNA helicase
MSLRDYQAEALDALYAGWQGGLRRIGVSLPTGTGKTHIMASLGRAELEDAPRPPAHPHGRVMYLVHRDTLVEQTMAKLRATLPERTSIGIVKAERNQVGARVLVASVHTLRSAARRATLPPIGLCVVDEAHVSVSPTYLAVFDHIRAMEPDGARLAGFSATWSRSDSTGLGDVWEDVVYAKSIKWAVQHGHLVKPRGIRIGEGADTSDVRVTRTTQGRDFSEADLERVVMLDSIRDAVVRGVLRHGAGRPGVLFAPTVASAEFFGDGLRDAGISTEGFYGHTNATDRRARDKALRAGELKMLTTCTAIAEGYDNPQLALAVLCRPTRHEGLFVQMNGRILRPWPGKADALLLDCVGATEDVKLRNAIDLSVTTETVDGDVVPDEIEETEPVGRDRVARIRKLDTEVELFAGTQVQWLTAQGIPFVSCRESLVFLVEGRDGWRVGQCHSRLGPSGALQDVLMVADGLSQEDALTVASDHAENVGTHLSRRSAAWRNGKPSDAQLAAARKCGLPLVDGMTRGQVSDQLSMAFAGRVLAPFRTWQEQEMAS